MRNCIQKDSCECWESATLKDLQKSLNESCDLGGVDSPQLTAKNEKNDCVDMFRSCKGFIFSGLEISSACSQGRESLWRAYMSAIVPLQAMIIL